jgi:hypothetical protein
MCAFISTTIHSLRSESCRVTLVRCCNTDLRFSRTQRQKQTSLITSSTWADRLAIPRIFINCRYIISLVQTDSLEIPLASIVHLKREITFSSKLFLIRLIRIFSSFFSHYLYTNTLYKPLVIIFDQICMVSLRHFLKTVMIIGILYNFRRAVWEDRLKKWCLWA